MSAVSQARILFALALSFLKKYEKNILGLIVL